MIFKKLSVNVEISIFTSGNIVLHHHKQKHYDILFLDIFMPESSGFDVAKKIRNMSLRTHIVFVTAKQELVYDSFEYHPFYFIRKQPIKALYTELEHVVKKLLVIFKQEKQIDIIDSGVGCTQIAVRDILYIKSEKHYLLYHLTSQNPIPIKERSTIGDKEPTLCEYDFFRPHQRYLVNMHHIDRFDTLINTRIVDGGAQIPISRNMKADALKRFRVFKRTWSPAFLKNVLQNIVLKPQLINNRCAQRLPSNKRLELQVF